MKLVMKQQARLASGLPAPIGSAPADAIALGAGLVRSIALRVAPPDLVDDAIQEGHKILIEIAPRYDVGRGVLFGTFAYTCIRRGLIEHVRKERAKQRRESPAPEMSEYVADGRPGPGGVAADRMERGRVLAAIRNLPRTERVAVYLRYYRGATCERIGDRLGITASGAHRVLTRAHRRLEGPLRDLARA